MVSLEHEAANAGLTYSEHLAPVIVDNQHHDREVGFHPKHGTRRAEPVQHWHEAVEDRDVGASSPH